VRTISANFINRLDIGNTKDESGVTKLRNEIYVLCRSSPSSYPRVIFCVFEDRSPFLLIKKIKAYEIKSPEDMASCERENCLYVSDSSVANKCIWKIRRKTGGTFEIIRWLKTDYQPFTLSLSSFNGQLLVIGYWDSWPILRIYGSDATYRSIQLPKDVERPRHAVETSTGNFIIIHRWTEKAVKLDSGLNGKQMRMWVVSEITRDRQMVIRRFIPSNETQILKNPLHLSLDSEDNVFVADSDNNRVILLDSDLTWNRILCPMKEEEETKILSPWRLCYDEDKKQLIVGGFLSLGEGVGPSIYTLRRKNELIFKS